MNNIDIKKIFQDLTTTSHDYKKEYQDVIFQVNSEKNLQSADCWNYFSAWKVGFDDINYEVLNCYSSDEFAYLNYELKGTHQGIYYNQLPSGIKINLSGVMSILKKNDQLTITIIEDRKTLDEKLNIFSDKIYTEEDFPNNDFNGPAGDIYRAILYSRNPPCGIDQLFVNKSRWMFQQVNPHYIKPIPYLETLEQEISSENVLIKLSDRDVKARWYFPKNLDYKNLPTLVYFHGGGWVMASVDSYDLVTKKLAFKGQVNVFSIDYRLAPENEFPSYYMDCYESYIWLREHLTDFGINNKKIAVAGDSVGGAMSGGLIHYCHQENKPKPDAVMMLSSCSDLIFENYHSFIEKSRKSVFISLGLALFQRATCVPIEYWRDPIYSPMYGDFSYFPPSLVMIGGDDPLRDDNKVLVNKLKQAGVKKVVEIFGEQMPHAYHIFLGMTKEEELAYDAMGKFLNETLT